MAARKRRKKTIRLAPGSEGAITSEALPENLLNSAYQQFLSEIPEQFFSRLGLAATRGGSNQRGALDTVSTNLTQGPLSQLFFRQLAALSDFQPQERLEHDARWRTWKVMATDQLNSISRQIGPGANKQQALANAWAAKVVSASNLLRTQHEPNRFGHGVSQAMQDYIKKEFGAPENFIGYERLGHASWGWDLDDIWSQIYYVWVDLKDAWWYMTNWVRGIDLGITAVWNRIKAVGDAVSQVYYTLRDTLSTEIKNVWSQITAWLKWLGEVVNAAIKQQWEQLTAWIKWLGDSLSQALNDVWQNIQRAMSRGFSLLVSTIQTRWLQIDFTLSAIRDMILSTSQASDLALRDSLAGLNAGWWNIVMGHTGLLRDPASGFLLKDPKDVFSGARELLTGFVRDGYNEIEGYLRAQAPITPHKVPTVAATALGTATGFGLAAHLSSSFFELAHPLKSLGLHQMSAFLADMGSFSAISAGSMGVMIAAAVRQPFVYYSQEIFRPIIPREMDLQIMAVKPDISMADFRTGMSWHGYSEKWIDAIQKTMFREPRYFELSFMMEDAGASLEWLFRKARRAGYSEEDANIFAPGLLKKVLRTQRQGLYMNVVRLYKEGYIDNEQFDTMLAPLELRPEAHDLAKQVAEAAFLYDSLGEMVKLLEAEYIKEVLTLGELEVGLASLGIQDVKVDMLLAKAQIKKLPRPRHKEKAIADRAAAAMQRKYISLYTQQFRKELLTAEEFQANLLAVGITPEMAAVTVSLEKTRRLKVPSIVTARTSERAAKDAQKLYTTLYKEMFRDGELTPEELTASFVAIGYDSAAADTMTRIEQAKQYKPPAIELMPAAA